MPIPGAPDPDDLDKYQGNSANTNANGSADDFDGSHPGGGKMKIWWAVLISLIVVISAIMLVMQAFESGMF